MTSNYYASFLSRPLNKRSIDNFISVCRYHKIPIVGAIGLRKGKLTNLGWLGNKNDLTMSLCLLDQIEYMRAENQQGEITLKKRGDKYFISCSYVNRSIGFQIANQ